MSALVVTAFTVGILGGVHCVGMCGGIVSALSLTGRGKTPAWATQGAYNAGRVASYTAAGALAGLAGSMGTLFDNVLPVQTALYVVANGILILLGLYLAGFGTAVLRLEAAGGAVWRKVQPVGRFLLPADTVPKALAVGAVWGWIPCGLVYSMLATALVSGSAASGALVMLAFGLGTLPNLLATGFLAGRVRALAADRRVRVGAGLLVLAMGVVGLLRAPGLAGHLREGILCLT